MPHLNTLFVTHDGSYLRKNHNTVVVEVERQVRVQVPLVHLAGIVCVGRAIVSPELLGACVASNIHVSFFGRTGRFLARVEGIPGGNVLLRRAQYRSADREDAALAISRCIVVGKVFNSRHLVARAKRDSEDAERKDSFSEAETQLSLLLRRADNAASLDELRGIEGLSARIYFSVLSCFLKRDVEAFSIARRTRQPPRDRTNALLSFGYALLLHDCAGALAGVGLDPAVGFLHTERPGRLSLALDLMEEFRTPVVDRLVVSLINRGQIQANDLREDPSGGWSLTDAGRKTFIAAYQDAKQTDVTHPVLEQKISWGRVPHLQALLLARHLRGDIPAYPPFTLR